MLQTDSTTFSYVFKKLKHDSIMKCASSEIEISAEVYYSSRSTLQWIYQPEISQHGKLLVFAGYILTQ